MHYGEVSVKHEAVFVNASADTEVDLHLSPEDNLQEYVPASSGVLDPTAICRGSVIVISPGGVVAADVTTLADAGMVTVCGVADLANAGMAFPVDPAGVVTVGVAFLADAGVLTGLANAWAASLADVYTFFWVSMHNLFTFQIG